MLSSIVISDIFGRTPALLRWCDHLSQTTMDIKIIDPYGGKDLSFKSETQAYGYFMDQVGLDKYCHIIETELMKHGKDAILIGFSVGASSIWRISQNKSLPNIKKAFCFYSSQIRHFMDLQPGFDIELIFPDQESHFDINLTIDELKKTPRVSCQKTSGSHGFMNELSKNYNPELCTKHTEYLLKIIRNPI